ncbi:MAG: MBL fold metallo-hydrolase [Clostridium sp.]|nr:MBL fold metallo-hydrolase [Clostridium sp.]
MSAQQRRRNRQRQADNDLQPGLFDNPAPGENAPLPPHPSIESFVARVRLSGGSTPTPPPPPAADPTIAPLETPRRVRPLMFMSFGSGSSGNCSYVGDGESGILVDAGIDADHVERTLLKNGIDIDSVAGICLTHDHSDHLHYAYTLLKRHRRMHLYCTPRTLSGMLRRHSMSRRIKDYHLAIYKEFPFTIGSLRITPFDVSHDGSDNVGFFIEHGTQRLAVATDLGSITERVDHYMRQAQHIVLESNYDEEMLRDGSYPEYLKARIRGPRGHLANTAAAEFLAAIYTPSLRNIFLCHLSHDNNLPEIALRTVREALIRAGAASVGDASRSLGAERSPVQVAALPRYDASPLYTLLAVSPPV